jgi:hypothetical protein
VTKGDRTPSKHSLAPEGRYSPLDGLGATAGEMIPGPWDLPVRERSNEEPLVLGARWSAGRGGYVNPERARPRSNPVAPSPASGVAEPDRGSGVSEGNHSSGSCAWP